MSGVHTASPASANLEVQEYSFKWLLSLPKDVRPLTLGKHFPRILNRLALISSDQTITVGYLRDLITPARRGRQGFPDAIVGELHRLYLHIWGAPDDDPWADARMDVGAERERAGA